MPSVGRGIADITGEDCGMLGNESDQRTAGIHQRLRSRAFVFRDDSQEDRGRAVAADCRQCAARAKRE